jgi:ABC-type Fe3+ transport system substrate-binding protein
MPTFYELLKQNPQLTKEMCSCGMSIKDSESTSLASKIFSAKTFLRGNGINPDSLSPALFETQIPKENSSKPTLVAFLPCGLRNAFKQAIAEEFPEFSEECDNLVIEGNLNYEKLIYHYIDKIDSAEELPDIFISADYNSFFHHHFLKNFLNRDYFEAIEISATSSLKENGYLHPENLMSMFSANLIVMVADTENILPDKMPKCWGCLLDDYYKKSIVFRGDKDFFCNATFFPYFQKYGIESIQTLGKNTLTGMHPSEMVKTMHQGNPSGAKIFVMPYSFALKVRNTERFKIISTPNGPIASPVQMLVKKGAYPNNKALIDFILSSKMGATLETLGFPSVNPLDQEILKSKNIFWLGWDFIQKNDIASLKDDIQKNFFSTYNKG